LLQHGYTYVDVRSELEFVTGHVPGALNVPVQRVEGDRLVDNPAFVSVMSKLFRTTDPLLIGCRSGGRSQLALERLLKAGFSELRGLANGFDGARDAFGRHVAGWARAGLPVESGDGGERSYPALLERVRMTEQG
jgi:rhodanese-related sulfurtransferase